VENLIDPRDSEARLIVGAINEDNLSKIMTSGIEPKDLIVWGDVLQFILDHNSKHGKIPSVETIHLAEPEFPSFTDDNLSFEFLLDVAQENAKRKRMKNALAHAADLADENPSEAVSFLIGALPDIKKEVKGKSTYADDTAQVRFDLYSQIKSQMMSGRGVGIRTGVKALDEQLLGWMPGDFAMIVGPPEVGKSWFLLRTSVVAYMAGSRILFLSLEMGEDDVNFRLDTLVGKEFGYTFQNDRLVTGQLTDEQEEEYKQYLTRIGGRKNWITSDLSDEPQLTVARVEGLIKEFAPNVVAIDPMMLMTASDGSMAVSWTALLEVAYGLKYLARRTQTVVLGIGPTVGDTFDSFDPATLGEFGLSRNATYSPDIILALAKSPDPMRRFIGIAKKRKGRAVEGKFPIAFDPNIGRVG